MLPEAHIAFIDEIYKSNAATLNSLLTIINEKVYHNGDNTIKCPLITMFAASNEVPEPEDGLDALHDRFLQRFYIEDIHSAQGLLAMYSNSLKPTKPVYDTLSVDDILFLQELTKEVTIPDELLGQLAQTMFDINSMGIRISGRRQVACLPILKASALLKGRISVDYDDIKVLNNILWEQLKDKANISKELNKIKDPATVYIDTTRESLYNLKDAFDNLDKNNSDYTKVLLKTSGDISKLMTSFTDTIDAKKDNLSKHYKNKVSILNKELQEFETKIVNEIKKISGIDISSDNVF